MYFLNKHTKNVIFSSLIFFSATAVKTETPNVDMDKAIIFQSAFNRCLLEEKLLNKNQVLKMNREGSTVSPMLFNPAIKILENGATQSQKEAQDIVISNLGGCKKYLRTFISTTMKKDSEQILKSLDNTGFNDDLIGRGKSYFDKNEGMGVVFCKNPIPEFTLNYDSNPTDEQVEKLCSCVWNKFPEGRWERNEMRRIFNGGDPNWRTKGMYERLGKAMKVCGIYDL